MIQCFYAFSGLDNSICTYGGLLSYRKHPATLVDVANNLTSVKTGATENFMESIAVPRNLRILLINTKVR
jgi:mevalonate kinase